MKITNILAFARKKLQDAKIESYQLDSLILLSKCLSLSKEQIIFNKDQILSQNQIDDFLSLIERRIKREPISHIIGRKEFFGQDFLVNSAVLDPRPDSETLIETVLNYFPNKEKEMKFLELGVGSGCLILTLLRFFKNTNATCVDISSDALNIAKQNCNFSNLNERCNFIQSDWFDSLDKNQKFDLIISNPPYIETKQIDFLQDEVKNYEPRIALDGGLDGLDCYRKIAKDGVNFLNYGSIIILEIGKDQENSVTKIFTDSGLELLEKRKDLAGIIRCLIFKKEI